MKDVITDRQAGLLVPMRSPEAIADAASTLMDDQTLRARLGRTAQEAARKQYTWDRAAEPVLHAYEALR